MSEWHWIVITASTLLLVFLVVKETKRKNGSHLILRLITSLFAVGSLALTAFPLTYLKKVKANGHNEIIVLTDGFNADSIARFLSKQGDSIPVMTFDEKIYNAHPFGAQYLTDVSFFRNKIIHVFGFGFNEEELQQLPKADVIFHPSPLPSGITSIHWTKKLRQGEKLWIQGRYHNAFSSNMKLSLGSFGVTLDSVSIIAKSDSSFSLSLTPKGEGRMSFMLSAVANGDTTERETIPVEVKEGERIKVLMLSSSPDFDQKFLKSNLANQQYEVVSRATISKNKFSSGYANAPTVSIDNITASLLDKFDVLIADATALSALSKPELSRIRAQVAGKGLGLVIRGDSAIGNAFYSASFPVSGERKDSSGKLSLYLFDTAARLPPLPALNSFFINAANAQPIVQDKQNKVYAGVTQYGAGKLVFTSLHNTYAWALAGDEVAYNQYWSALLNKAVANSKEDETWNAFPDIARIDEPVRITLQTAGSAVTRALVNGVAIPLKNNINLPFLWTGIYYPQREGWQTGIGTNGKPWHWFAYRKTDWQNVARSQKIIGTQQYISTNLRGRRSGADQEADYDNRQTEFPKIYLYLLFLASCGYLWWEGKKQ